MDNSVKISVVIPIYNSEKSLYRCLESIQKQIYKNIEVIMIDDGSQDNSVNICRKFLDDKRFILKSYSNSGVGQARNRGIENASGEMIAFVDSDDLLKEDYLSQFMKLYREDIDYYISGIIYEDLSRIRGGKRIEYKYPIMDKKYKSLGKRDFLEIFISRIPEPCFGAPYGKLFKTEIIKKNNILFETSHNLAEDLIFNINYIAYVNKIMLIKNASYYYKMFVPGSLSRISHPYSYTKQRWEKVVHCCKAECSTFGVKIDNIERVAKRNIVLSIFRDKTISYREKEKLYYECSCRKSGFVYTYLMNMIEISIRNMYRYIQRIVYNINEKRNVYEH